MLKNSVLGIAAVLLIGAHGPALAQTDAHPASTLERAWSAEGRLVIRTIMPAGSVGAAGSAQLNCEVVSVTNAVTRATFAKGLRLTAITPQPGTREESAFVEAVRLPELLSAVTTAIGEAQRGSASLADEAFGQVAAARFEELAYTAGPRFSFVVTWSTRNPVVLRVGDETPIFVRAQLDSLTVLRDCTNKGIAVAGSVQ
jgi:hypothetical protein